MKIEEDEEGKRYWATNIEKDIVYINSLKNAEVVNFFMSIYQDVDEIKTSGNSVFFTKQNKRETI